MSNTLIKKNQIFLILTFFSLAQIQFKTPNFPGFYPFHKISIISLTLYFMYFYFRKNYKMIFFNNIKINIIEILLLIIFVFQFYLNFININFSENTIDQRVEKNFIYTNTVIFLTFIVTKIVFSSNQKKLSYLNNFFICFIFINLIAHFILNYFELSYQNYNYNYNYNIFYEKRIFALTGNPQYLALATIFPILYFLNKPKKTLNSIFFFCVAVFVLLWTESRSSIIAIILSLNLLYFYTFFVNFKFFYFEKKKLLIKFLLFFMIILFTTSIIFFLLDILGAMNLNKLLTGNILDVIIRKDNFDHSRIFFLNKSLENYFINYSFYNVLFGGMDSKYDFNFYIASIKKFGFPFIILYMILNYVTFKIIFNDFLKKKNKENIIMLQLILFNLIYSFGISFLLDTFLNLHIFLFFIPILYAINIINEKRITIK